MRRFRLAAAVGKCSLQPPTRGFAYRVGNNNASRRRLRFQAVGNVDGVPVEVDGGVLGLTAIGVGHGLLELDGSTEGIDGTRELDQSAVARQLNQAATVTCQHGLETLFAMLAQASHRAALVPAH
jgi:hypothetical protein